ncbi:MAG: hypothetical protein RMY64_25925 [Nostoc sp. DedQUE08]|nr:hypothetical protein [Nostoc sp. DedQUE08]MDZ8069010.1 hypothetical protein [Nostoc sp. DedQUE08]
MQRPLEVIALIYYNFLSMGGAMSATVNYASLTFPLLMERAIAFLA